MYPLREDVDEEIGEEGSQEQEVFVANMEADGVFVEDGAPLREMGYGFSERGGVLLPKVAALNLQSRGIIEVLEEGKEVSFQELLHGGRQSDPMLFLKYLVYRDLRSKGRKVRAGMHDMPYLFFYEKPSRPCSHIVASFSRKKRIPLDELQKLLSLSARYKKGVYLALVDEEGEVSYYEIRRFDANSMEEEPSDRSDSADLVGPMMVVWDHTGALSLYKEGYFGKPIGLRKPKSMTFERPITLSFIEALYLTEKGRVELKEGERELSPQDLMDRGSREKNFRERYQVYKGLKDSGMIVKSGMKFGVDFAVYEYGPGIDHAPFMIHVFPKDANITPTEIVRAGRLAASVKKKFVVAQVDVDRDLTLMLSFARVKP